MKALTPKTKFFGIALCALLALATAGAAIFFLAQEQGSDAGQEEGDAFVAVADEEPEPEETAPKVQPARPDVEAPEPEVDDAKPEVTSEEVASDAVDDAVHAADREVRSLATRMRQADVAPGQSTAKKKSERKQEELKPALLQIVTNFDKADVTVNGLTYPEYFPPGEQEGMVLPAGGPYLVEVKFGDNTKTYQIHLRAYETRLLLVELSGYDGASRRPAPKPASREKEQKEEKEEKKDEKKEPGRVTVYSKPPGQIVVDGDNKGEKTPGTVEVENGRHEIQVEYETGGTSEKKIVRVRNGSRIKLFFRERK